MGMMVKNPPKTETSTKNNKQRWPNLVTGHTYSLPNVHSHWRLRHLPLFLPYSPHSHEAGAPIGFSVGLGRLRQATGGKNIPGVLSLLTRNCEWEGRSSRKCIHPRERLTPAAPTPRGLHSEDSPRLAAVGSWLGGWGMKWNKHRLEACGGSREDSPFPNFLLRILCLKRASAVLEPFKYCKDGGNKYCQTLVGWL